MKRRVWGEENRKLYSEAEQQAVYNILERLGSVTVETYEEPTKHEVPMKKLKQWLEPGSPESA